MRMRPAALPMAENPARRRRIHRNSAGTGDALGDGPSAVGATSPRRRRGRSRRDRAVSMALASCSIPTRSTLGGLPGDRRERGRARHGANVGRPRGADRRMTIGFPVSPLTPATFLLVGLCRPGARPRTSASRTPWLFAASLLMVVAGRPLRSDCAVNTPSESESAAGAGYSGDRIEPAMELAEQGAPRLPRVRVPHPRTIALAQRRRRTRSGAPATIRCSRNGMRCRAAGVRRRRRRAS